MKHLDYCSLKNAARVVASFFPPFLGMISTPAIAAETAKLSLPILLSPDDASIQSKTTVQPMLTAPVDILGPRRMFFRSTASVSEEVRWGRKGREVSVSPADRLVEYEIKSDTQSFPAYCRAYPKKPLSSLICLADRDNDGDFDQVWLGETANPKVWVPFSFVQLQVSPFTPQKYSVQMGPIPSDLQFGFSVTSAGGLANKRELHLQVTNGTEKVYMFYNRITGPSRLGSVDTTIFDSQIRLYGEDSKTVTYSIEKPLTQPKYNIFHPGITRNVWMYVPG